MTILDTSEIDVWNSLAETRLFTSKAIRIGMRDIVKYGLIYKSKLEKEWQNEERAYDVMLRTNVAFDIFPYNS